MPPSTRLATVGSATVRTDETRDRLSVRMAAIQEGNDAKSDAGCRGRLRALIGVAHGAGVPIIPAPGKLT